MTDKVEEELMSERDIPGGGTSRRDFLKVGTAAVALTSAVRIPGVYAAGSDVIRVGLIGCGGRGTGAADDVLNADAGVRLVALADVFRERLDMTLETVKTKHPAKVDVPQDRRFVGLDAYEKLLAADVDYVILATPPGFRPQHLKAAVAAAKHIFTEKPVAVDGPGVRACLEAHEEAKKKNLGIGVGTQRHHQTAYLETMKRIEDGAIGAILAARCYWNQGPLWVHPRQPEWSGLEWQLRNWYYFTWLCGDHIVEQHVHNIDVVNWALKAHPIKALGSGGRQVRTEPEFGHIFDHFTVDFEYPNGVHAMSMCRQIPNCDNNISEALTGTLGSGTLADQRFTITGKNAWRFTGKDNKPYLQEHIDLIASIRAGKPYNELQGVCESTLTAIMGRMSAYTGKVVTWEDALNSKESLMPARLVWGPMPVPAVPMPGRTELA